MLWRQQSRRLARIAICSDDDPVHRWQPSKLDRPDELLQGFRGDWYLLGDLEHWLSAESHILGVGDRYVAWMRCPGGRLYSGMRRPHLHGSVMISLDWFQFLGIVFSHMLAKAIRRIKTQGLVEQLQSRQQLYEQLARGQDEKVTPVLYTPASSDA